eukprot:4731388-Heterocapsa_arctica.AAC.1
MWIPQRGGSQFRAGTCAAVGEAGQAEVPAALDLPSLCFSVTGGFGGEDGLVHLLVMGPS